MPPNPAYQYILSGPYSYLHQVTEKVLNKISIGNQSDLTPSLSTDPVHSPPSCLLLSTLQFLSSFLLLWQVNVARLFPEHVFLKS